METTLTYKGYTIERTSSYFPGYDYFPTNEGRQDDADLDGEDYIYCGNVRHADSIDDAKDAIWEKVMVAIPQHKVVMNKQDYYFDWVEDAIKFAVKWNAEEFIPAVNT